eukprot:CAMPEP_0119018118 /NCGR_PEP_ID=MMETSP1176-20130426/18628_1 /TAXON_ID=265551 /ORGANISM="Synedropsis recta cf, Strain CCMP1620" /LENGTH=109 /DNA_ID=CAMNT_0006972045 /DNA_START=11 /DNA_END=337 /DNA_ORIENTATION=+
MNAQLKNLEEVEAQNRIKLALQTMMLLRNTNQLSSTRSDEKDGSNETTQRAVSLKRAASESIAPPAKKQRLEPCTDDALDQAADEVCPVTEWERIMENWNPEMENLPFL